MFSNRIFHRRFAAILLLSVLTAVGLLVVPAFVHAQDDPAPASTYSPNPTPTPYPRRTKVKPRATPAPTPTPDDLYTWAPPKLGDFTLVAYYKSIFDTGNKINLETDGGQNYWWKNEILVGIKHSSGFGIGVDDAVIDQQFDGHEQDSHSYYNPFVVIYHPAFYKSDDWTVLGWLRQYFPQTTTAQAVNQYWTRYFLIVNYQANHNFSISNSFIPGYISQNVAPAAYDNSADIYIEDETDFGYALSKYLAIGFGQYTQYEHHPVNNPGWETDLFPYIDITPIGNILLEGRVYFPIFVDQTMSFGSQSDNASINQLWGELVLKVSF